MRVFNLFILSFCASIFLCAALLLHMPGSFADNALWTAFFSPFVWVGFMFWTYWANSNRNITIVLTAVTIIGAVAVYFADPTVRINGV